jgi:hypothetical protein
VGLEKSPASSPRAPIKAKLSPPCPREFCGSDCQPTSPSALWSSKMSSSRPAEHSLMLYFKYGRVLIATLLTQGESHRSGLPPWRIPNRGPGQAPGSGPARNAGLDSCFRRNDGIGLPRIGKKYWQQVQEPGFRLSPE